jgi:hypothetical protein
VNRDFSNASRLAGLEEKTRINSGWVGHQHLKNHCDAMPIHVAEPNLKPKGFERVNDQEFSVQQPEHEEHQNNASERIVVGARRASAGIQEPIDLTRSGVATRECGQWECEKQQQCIENQSDGRNVWQTLGAGRMQGGFAA